MPYICLQTSNMNWLGRYMNSFIVLFLAYVSLGGRVIGGLWQSLEMNATGRGRNGSHLDPPRWLARYPGASLAVPHETLASTLPPTLGLQLSSSFHSVGSPTAQVDRSADSIDLTCPL